MASVAVNPPKTPVTKGSHGIAAATLPNICKMPPPPPPFLPTPLPNIGQSGKDTKGYSQKVKVEGNLVAITGASFGSIGDIASKPTGGGVVSSNAEGPTKFISPGELTVRVNGKFVQYLGDQMLNNCGAAGAPPNSATMQGEVQAPAIVLGGETHADLAALADKCNRQTNKELGHCPGGPTGPACTSAGTAKHKCCEKAIKQYNTKNPGSKLKSEVPFDKGGNPMSAASESAARSAANTAYSTAKAAGQATKGVWAAAYFGGGGAAFKADVLVEGADGHEKAYDFKFSCKDDNKPGSVKPTADQLKKYKKCTGLVPVIIHKDGRKC